MDAMLRSLLLGVVASEALAKEPLALIADNATVVPSDAKSATFDFFSAPVAAGSFVAFFGAGGAEPGCRFNCDTTNGVFAKDTSDSGGDLHILVRAAPGGDLMPDGHAVNQTGDVALASDGSAIFFAASSADVAAGFGVGSLLLAPATSSAAHREADRTFDVAVAIGDAAPGDSGNFVKFEPGSLTVSGSAADGIQFVFEATTDAGVMGLYRAARPAEAVVAGANRRLEEGGAWTLTKIVDNSTAMPAPDSDTTFKEFGDENGSPISASGGHVLFFAGNLKGMMDPLNRDGVYLWSEKAGAVSYVASSNHTEVPGWSGWHFTAFGNAAMAENKNGDAVLCFMGEAANMVDPARVGIWCRLDSAADGNSKEEGTLKLMVGSTTVIPDSPEPTSPHNLFQYVDYPAVSLDEDGITFMLAFQGNDGLGRRGVYRALAPDQLTTVTDWQDPVLKEEIFNIQLNVPAYGGGPVALWLGMKDGNEGIFATDSGSRALDSGSRGSSTSDGH